MALVNEMIIPNTIIMKYRVSMIESTMMRQYIDTVVNICDQ
jgi:hypothetical protein